MDKEKKVYQVFQTIYDDYDKMNDVISFKQHRKWKEQMIRRAASFSPQNILDICAGTGDIALWLAKACPDADIIGLDFSENMLKTAERRRKETGAENVRFVHGSALELPFPDNGFDCVTISFGLRNLPDYDKALAEMFRVLKPGGRIFCLDASYPTSPWIKPFFKLYFKFIMPQTGKMIAHHKEEYQWLNESTEAFLNKKELIERMEKTGFQKVRCKTYLLGAAACHSGAKQAPQ